jgi:uncharacterized membrane protein
MKSKMNQQLEIMKSSNPDNWIGGFYVNSEDSRIFVRKKSRMGWTLNFGNRYTYVAIAFIILAVIAYQMQA